MNLKTQDVNRFWNKVTVRGPNACWPWKGGRIPAGYGHFWLDGKVLKAHRIAFELQHGSTHKNVLHSCDNPPCCNPNHLFDGTHAENMADRDAKNRQAHSERNGRAILTIKQVKSIREEFDRGATQRSLARKYNIHRSSIKNIVYNITWKDV